MGSDWLKRDASGPRGWLYAILFLLLFAQFPLHRSLPGNSDTLLSIALSNLFLEKVALVLRGDALPLVLFPAPRFLPYGENCFGLGFVFMFFKLLLRDDLKAYYFFLVTLFASSAWALSRLAGLFVRSSAAAAIAGIAFTLSGFTLANLDDPNLIFVFFPATAWYHLARWSREERPRDLRLGIFLSALQIWFGFYVFLFQVLGVAAFAVANLRRFTARPGAAGEALRLTLLAVATAGPLLGLYVHNHFAADVFSPYNNPYSLEASSLSGYHFGNVLPHNLLYSDTRNQVRELDVSGWYRIRKTAFPGLVLPLLALLGLAAGGRSGRRDLLFFGAFFAVLLALAFGNNLPGFALLVAMPFGSYFRVASRFYLFALIPAAVLAAAGAQTVSDRVDSSWPRRGRWVLGALGLLFVAENVPFPLPRFDYGDLIAPPPLYVGFFAAHGGRAVIADLPSTYLARLPDTVPVWTYSRDILYMNWQTPDGLPPLIR